MEWLHEAEIHPNPGHLTSRSCSLPVWVISRQGPEPVGGECYKPCTGRYRDPRMSRSAPWIVSGLWVGDGNMARKVALLFDVNTTDRALRRHLLAMNVIHMLLQLHVKSEAQRALLGSGIALKWQKCSHQQSISLSCGLRTGTKLSVQHATRLISPPAMAQAKIVKRS